MKLLRLILHTSIILIAITFANTSFGKTNDIYLYTTIISNTQKRTSDSCLKVRSKKGLTIHRIMNNRIKYQGCRPNGHNKLSCGSLGPSLGGLHTEYSYFWNKNYCNALRLGSQKRNYHDRLETVRYRLNNLSRRLKKRTAKRLDNAIDRIIIKLKNISKELGKYTTGDYFITRAIDGAGTSAITIKNIKSSKEYRDTMLSVTPRCGARKATLQLIGGWVDKFEKIKKVEINTSGRKVTIKNSKLKSTSKFMNFRNSYLLIHHPKIVNTILTEIKKRHGEWGIVNSANGTGYISFKVTRVNPLRYDVTETYTFTTFGLMKALQSAKKRCK